MRSLILNMSQKKLLQEAEVEFLLVIQRNSGTLGGMSREIVGKSLIPIKEYQQIFWESAKKLPVRIWEEISGRMT